MIKSRIYNKYYIYNKSFVIILNIIAIFVELKILLNNYKIIYSTIIHKNNNNMCKKIMIILVIMTCYFIIEIE